MAKYKRKRRRKKDNDKIIEHDDSIIFPTIQAMTEDEVKYRGKFNTEFIRQAYVACRDFGASNHDLANLFGVVDDTILSWRRFNPEFNTAIKVGKDEFDSGRVEKRLLDRALGIEFDEIMTENVNLKGTLPDDTKIDVPAQKVRTTKKFIPPDVGAIMYWLSNRMPDRWITKTTFEGRMAHVHAHKHSFDKDETKSFDLNTLDVEQLESLREIMLDLNGRKQLNAAEVEVEDVG